jgi:hypothetical protein
VTVGKWFQVSFKLLQVEVIQMNEVLFAIEIPRTYEAGLFIGWLVGVIIGVIVK